jgi:hypothetical protein
MSVMEIVVVPNASVEKDFHKMMESKHASLVLPLSTVTGNFKEVYLYNPEVIKQFYRHFSSSMPGESHTNMAVASSGISLGLTAFGE